MSERIRHSNQYQGLELYFKDGSKDEPPIAPAILDMLLVQAEPLRFAIMAALASAPEGLRLGQLLELLAQNGLTKKKAYQSTVSHTLTDLRSKQVVCWTNNPRDPDKLTDYAQAAMSAYDRFASGLVELTHAAIFAQARAQLGDRLYRKLLQELQVPPVDTKSKVRRFIPGIATVMETLGHPFKLAVMLALDANESMQFQPLRTAVSESLNKDAAPSTLSNMITELDGKRLVERIPPCYALTHLGRKSMVSLREYHNFLLEPLIQQYRHVVYRASGLSSYSDPEPLSP